MLWHKIMSGPAFWGLPAFGEAFQRAVYACWGAVLILAAAQVLGGRILALLRWKPAEKPEGIFFRLATGLGAFAYLLLGLAALSAYRVQSIQLLIAIILSGGVIQGLACHFWDRSAVSKDLFETKRLLPGARVLVKYLGDSLKGNRIWILVVAVAVLIALIGSLAPEIEYDALWYHLWLPKVWLQQGGAVDMVEEYISLYPLTWELVYGAGLTLGGVGAAKLLHFACLLLIALLVGTYTRRYLPSVSPWIAGALFITIPTILWEATTAYIDLALTLHTVAAMYALAKYLEGKQSPWLVLSGIHLGLALATKHLALIFLALLASMLALSLWRESRNLRRALGPVIFLGALSMLIPLPWYLRSWWASGNPVFPELYGIFGASPPTRWDAITESGLDHFLASFGRPRSFVNLLTLPWDMVVHAFRYSGTLGPLFLWLLPGLVMGRRKNPHLPALACFSLAYLALWASPLSSFQMRFLVPLTPALALLAAEGYARLEMQLDQLEWTQGKRLLQGSLALLLLLNLPPFTSLHEGDRGQWEGWLAHVIHQVPISVVTGVETQDTYLERNVPSYAAWRFINAHLPEDVHILTFSGGDHFYSERARLWSDATIARPAVWGAARGEELGAFQALRQLGITHILFDMRYIGAFPPDTLAIAQPEVIESRYILEYNDPRYRLYRILEE